MKKAIVLVGLVLLVVVSLALAGAKRITPLDGTITVNLVGHDSTSLVTSMKKSDKFPILNYGQNLKYDKVFGTVYMEDMTSDSAAGEGYRDTCIVQYCFGTDWYKVVAEVDTILMPDSTTFVWDEDIWLDGTKFLNHDSVAADWWPNATGDYRSLFQEEFWIEYWVCDSAGTGGVTAAPLTGTIKYHFIFTEDD